MAAVAADDLPVQRLMVSAAVQAKQPPREEPALTVAALATKPDARGVRPISAKIAAHSLETLHD